MLLFRSEEDLPAAGATVAVDVLQRLGRVWYGNRLDPDWRPRTRDESQRILTDHGLTSEFWQLP